MLAFSFILALGAAVANAALIPSPLIRGYPGYAAPVYHRYSPIAAGLVVARGSGLEGQYVPDRLETLYNDGSYRPEARAAPSPYGYVPAGSGLEGHYVPDNTEQLYDDGSYRPEPSPVPLAASPYGLVAAGSGIEGRYVPDLTERLYDDGSYRPEFIIA
ncbi:hypothetical protein NQ315_005160 [Exocentrus adspersus]|uniref:Uncharacterized protein n=1 Tax=Exocentrus adspersus TaxID=1586481 RepID=A0AAV8VVK4_9CUCU|nr:hypothetical protein NQ315_005160 [Exocentrus adspersus]